jgi:hypothetical protein
MKKSALMTLAVLAGLTFAACGGEGSADGSSPTASTAGATGDTATDDSSESSQFEGTWTTPRMTKADHVAAAEAAECTKALIDSHFASWPDDVATVHILEFDNGSLTESASIDGSAPTPGSFGTYEVVDDDTLSYTEPCCGTMTFDYRVDGDELTLQIASFTCGEVEDPAPFYIFQGAPFQRG